MKAKETCFHEKIARRRERNGNREMIGPVFQKKAVSGSVIFHPAPAANWLPDQDLNLD